MGSEPTKRPRRMRTNIAGQEELVGALYVFAHKVEAMTRAGETWGKDAGGAFRYTPAKHDAITAAMDTILAGFKYAKVDLQ